MIPVVPDTVIEPVQWIVYDAFQTGASITLAVWVILGAARFWMDFHRWLEGRRERSEREQNTTRE